MNPTYSMITNTSHRSYTDPLSPTKPICSHKKIHHGICPCYRYILSDHRRKKDYVLHCETLVRWFPHRPGFIVGCGLLAYTGGAVVLCWLFARLMAVSGVVGALYMTAFILTVPSVIAAMFLSFPPVSSSPNAAERDIECRQGQEEQGAFNDENDMQRDEEEKKKIGEKVGNSIVDVSETTALLLTETAGQRKTDMNVISLDIDDITRHSMDRDTDSDSDSNSTTIHPSLSATASKASSSSSSITTTITNNTNKTSTSPSSAFSSAFSSIRFLATQPSFWLYVSTILSTGAPYSLLPYFFKLASVYHIPFSFAMHCFQLVGLIGTVLALCAGILIDVIASPVHNTSGAKRMLIYALCLQLGLFGVLSLGERNGDGVFVVVMMLVMLTNAHYGCAAVLARDVFGAERSALAFGVGGGLAIGTGEGMSVQIMAFVEHMARMKKPSRIIDDVVTRFVNRTKSMGVPIVDSLQQNASTMVQSFVPTKSTYVPCFVACAAWTVIGLWSVAGLRVRMGQSGNEGRATAGKECGRTTADVM